MPQGRTFTHTYSHHGQGTPERSRGSEALTLRRAEALRQRWPVHTGPMYKARNSKETPDLTVVPYYGFRPSSWITGIGGSFPKQRLKAQGSSVTQLCPTLCDPWTAACQASLLITNSRNLFKLISIESVMPSSHLILCHPLLLLSSIFPRIRVFLNKSVFCIWWPKNWSFSFSNSPSNEYSGLISFRMDWLDLLAV